MREAVAQLLLTHLGKETAFAHTVFLMLLRVVQHLRSACAMSRQTLRDMLDAFLNMLCQTTVPERALYTLVDHVVVPTTALCFGAELDTQYEGEEIVHCFDRAYCLLPGDDDLSDVKKLDRGRLFITTYRFFFASKSGDTTKRKIITALGQAPLTLVDATAVREDAEHGLWVLSVHCKNNQRLRFALKRAPDVDIARSIDRDYRDEFISFETDHFDHTKFDVMQVMLDRIKKLSELAAPGREYPQQLTNVEVDDKDATLSDPAVVAAVQTVTERLGDEGRILLRKSGTEPVLRVMVEAAAHELCEENVAYVIDVMQKSGHLLRVR